MRNDNPRPAAWLKTDRAYKWKLGRVQGRIEQWSARLSLTPCISFDWECGMVTLGLGWLFWFGCIDLEFDTKYDASQNETEYPLSR